MNLWFRPKYIPLLSILLVIYCHAESLNIAGFTFPSLGGKLTPNSWETVLNKCQDYLANERLDAFTNLAQAAISYVPPGQEQDGELLMAELLYHSGKGPDAYQKVKKLIDSLQQMTPEERKKQAIISQGWLKKFLLRVAAYPLIAREQKLENRTEGMPNDLLPVNHSVLYTSMDLRNALNMCDLYRSLDSAGFAEINKTIQECFNRKRTFSLGYRNHGRVEINPERASDQAIISLDLWAKPALPNGLARQIQLYWGMDFFANCLPRSISIYELSYATTGHIKYEVGKIVEIDTYGSEDIDRGYRAYAETSGTVEASLTDVLGWFGMSPTSWHASVVTPKVKKEETPVESEEPIPTSGNSSPTLPARTPDFQ